MRLIAAALAVVPEAIRMRVFFLSSLRKLTLAHGLIIWGVVFHVHCFLVTRIATSREVLRRHVGVALRWASIVVIVTIVVRAILILLVAVGGFLIIFGSAAALIVQPLGVGILLSSFRVLSLAVVRGSSIVISWRTLPVPGWAALVITAEIWIILWRAVEVPARSVIIVLVLIHWRSLLPLIARPLTLRA